MCNGVVSFLKKHATFYEISPQFLYQMEKQKPFPKSHKYRRPKCNLPWAKEKKKSLAIRFAVKCFTSKYKISSGGLRYDEILFSVCEALYANSIWFCLYHRTKIFRYLIKKTNEHTNGNAN